ncbi:MAG: uncharacterized protein PWQ64_574 [Desulfomicrobiaceae bacterium]|nr:uncharacterized protein [Desulfomicrobiaceae bacterium]
MHEPYRRLAPWLRQRFGTTVRIIPLDSGGTCPNRDGTLGRGGCTFCNPHGSGSGLAACGLGLREQYLRAYERLARRSAPPRAIAYLQSYSATHGPARHLAAQLAQLRGLPGLVGITVGTRPDTLDADKWAVLRAAPEPVLWLEMGLQSAHDVTLRRIHRGHDAAAFARACNQAHVHGFAVCAHVMAGLPGETMQQWRKTLAFLNDLPITGVKFHNLLIVRGSILEGLWRRGSVALLSRAETIQWIVEGVAALRPDIIIHRLTADPAPGELIAPGFAADKRGLHAAIHLALREQRIHQGCRLPANTQELP